MTLLWTGQAMLEATGGRPLGRMPDAVTGISIDSRSLQAGEAFFAIRGDALDGHDFASAATAAGASVLVVAEARLPALGRLTVPMIVVDDTLKALERLAAAARARSRARIIAVTGSAGKTTTKEALRHVLEGFGTVHASAKSFNNHWGVPLTLARLPADADFGVFEVGMNHAGEIRPLVRLIRPHVAVITMIAAAHLGHFDSLDAIARAKAEIFDGIEPGGVAILNRDDARYGLLEKLARAAGVRQIVGFGEHLKAKVRLADVALGPDRSRFTVRLGGRDLEVELGVPGRHQVQNALAVIAAVQAAGVDPQRAAGRLASLAPEQGRGQRIALTLADGAATMIDESYNANPASMRAAIALLDQAEPGPGGRRIAVLGDMRELGAHAAALHAELAPVLAASHADLVYLAGPEMAALAAALTAPRLAAYHDTAAALAPLVTGALRPGDVVMLKASNGVGFGRIVAELKTAYGAKGKVS